MESEKSETRSKLEDQHEPEQIQDRVASEDHDYLGDAVLGAIDGGVTTFGIIAGAVGGGFGTGVVVVLGFAKLVADGFSMAVSNYLRARSVADRLEDARQTEHHHIEHIPEGEQREVREIFAQKGFEGAVLDEIVDTITDDHDQWVDIMLSEELGLPTRAPSPFRAGGSTFLAFLLIGLIPLLPFLIPGLSLDQAFLISGIVTAIGFLGVGLAKGIVLNQPVLRSGLETLVTGAGAAGLAYVVSSWMRGRYGVG